MADYSPSRELTDLVQNNSIHTHVKGTPAETVLASRINAVFMDIANYHIKTHPKQKEVIVALTQGPRWIPEYRQQLSSGMGITQRVDSVFSALYTELMTCAEGEFMQSWGYFTAPRGNLTMNVDRKKTMRENDRMTRQCLRWEKESEALIQRGLDRIR